MKLFGSSGLVLFLLHDVKHVGLELSISDEITWLFFFELNKDDVGNLGFTRILEQEPHDIRSFLLIDVIVVLDIGVLPGLSDLFLVEVFLLLFLNWVIGVWQHI